MSNSYDPNPPRTRSTATIVLVVVLLLLAISILACGALGIAGYMLVRQAEFQFDSQSAPGDATAVAVSQSLVSEGRYDEALGVLDDALVTQPDLVEALNSKAWLLATCPDASIRNGKQAVELAKQACSLTEFQHPAYVDTLAAAHAEQGSFDQAAEWQEKALDANTVPELGEGMLQRLLLYRAESPYREGPDGQPVMPESWTTDDASNTRDLSPESSNGENGEISESVAD